MAIEDTLGKVIRREKIKKLSENMFPNLSVTEEILESDIFVFDSYLLVSFDNP